MNLTDRQAALLAGISLLLMAAVDGYAYGYAYNSLVIADDANATYENIRSSTGLYTGGVIGWVIIFILDLLVAWGLYRFFQNINPSLSRNAGILRAVYTLFLGSAIWNLIQVYPLLDGTEVNPEVMERLQSFASIWNYGLIIFGLHLVGLGMLAIKRTKDASIFGISTALRRDLLQRLECSQGDDAKLCGSSCCG